MKSIFLGVASAIVGLGLFFSGFFVGADVAMGQNQGYVNYLNETSKHTESAQMQCIHWVDQWVSKPTAAGLPGEGPVFGMYTALCGSQGSK